MNTTELLQTPKQSTNISDLKRQRLVPPQRQTAINDERASFTGELSAGTKVDMMALQSLQTQDQLNQFSQELGLDIPSELPELRVKKTSTDERSIRQNARNKLLQEQQNAHKLWLDKQDTKMRKKIEDSNTRLKNKLIQKQLSQGKKPLLAIEAPPAITLEDISQKELKSVNKQIKEASEKMNKLLLKKTTRRNY